MARIHTLLLAAPFILHCGGGEPVPTSGPCSGLTVRAVDQAIDRPANIAVRLEVQHCDGTALTNALTADDFSISENGAQMSSYEALRMIKPMRRDIAERTLVLLDISGSITRSGLRPQMVEGARTLLENLDPQHQIAIYGFDGRADLVPYTHFTADRTALAVALDELAEAPVVDDSTNLFGAVVNGLDILDSEINRETGEGQVAKGNLILFTDGTDHAGRVGASTARSAVSRSDHSTFAIGVGAEMDTEMLSALGRTASLVVVDGLEVVAAFSDVATELSLASRRDYVVSYCSPKRAGYHTLRIDVRSGEETGSVSVPFNAERFSAGCDPSASSLVR